VPFFGLEMQWEICYYKPKLRGLGKGRQDETDCTDLYERNLLVNKMKRTAKERGIEAEICAMSELAFTRYEKPTDVLLLGPQVSFRLEEMKQKLCPAGVRVALIEPETFARMDAEAVLQQAMEA